VRLKPQKIVNFRRFGPLTHNRFKNSSPNRFRNNTSIHEPNPTPRHRAIARIAPSASAKAQKVAAATVNLSPNQLRDGPIAR
jgi:hypothetical protein